MKNVFEWIVAGVLAILIIAALYGISWAIICGLLKLIAFCFGIGFRLSIATGIWLIICLIQLIFGRGGRHD